MATKIRSMMESIQAHDRLIKHLKATSPCDHERNKEDGVCLVWELNRGSDPFHADGLGKTRHNEDADD